MSRRWPLMACQKSFYFIFHFEPSMRTSLFHCSVLDHIHNLTIFFNLESRPEICESPGTKQLVWSRLLMWPLACPTKVDFYTSSLICIVCIVTHKIMIKHTWTFFSRCPCWLWAACGAGGLHAAWGPRASLPALPERCSETLQGTGVVSALMLRAWHPWVRLWRNFPHSPLFSFSNHDICR